MYVLTGTEMKDVDRIAVEEYGIPGMTLMENAGEAGYKEALRLLPGHNGRTLVLCGGGNNGGDGYVIARRMLEDGLDVTVYSLVEQGKIKGDGFTAHSRYLEAGGNPCFIHENGSMELLAGEIEKADLIVDALLGTGIDRPVKEHMSKVISLVNRSCTKVLSVDIPSGVSGNDGKILGCAVKAQVTVTFQSPKVGCVVYPGREYVGELIIKDIGIPEKIIEKNYGKTRLITRQFVNTFIMERRKDIHKGTCGKVLIVAGSKGMAGAAALCGKGALRAGAGLLVISAKEELFPILQTALPEATCLSRRLTSEVIAGNQAIVIGPGLGDDDEHVQLIEQILSEYRGTVVLDADGLNILARNKKILKKISSSLVITPHPGEAGRLLSRETAKINEERLESACSLAEEFNACAVLKGASTVVAAQGGKTYINKTGNPGMATGGSGDVLSGVIAALSAQGLTAEEAACCGVYLHGLAGDLAAGDLGEYGIIASDIAFYIAKAIHTILEERVQIE